MLEARRGVPGLRLRTVRRWCSHCGGGLCLNGTVTVTFPDCWDGDMNDLNNGPANMVKSRNGVCPSTHKYRIPRIFYLIRYNGTITSRTTVSSGGNLWAPFGSEMHADYLAANQPVFNDRLIDLCLRNAPDSVTVAHPDCG